MSPATPGERIRTLLLRADNVVKSSAHPPDAGDRRRRALLALEEARQVARDPAVAPEIRELVERRLEALGA